MAGPSQEDMDQVLQRMKDLETRLAQKEDLRHVVFANRKLTKYSGDKENYEDWKVEARATMTEQ